ncbi:hypothetical protein [Streptomyces hawaiiensis]|nr:hypothetical protein [Streptomyces hawaiiensis]
MEPRWVDGAAAIVDSFLFPSLVDDPNVTLTNWRGASVTPTV